MATTSADGQHHRRLSAANDSAAPAPPPPTPSAAPHRHLPHTSDPLSHLFLRLPPTLSLTSRLRPSPGSVSAAAAAATPPLVHLSPPSGNLLSAAAQLGFFQLPHHHHHLLPAAVLEAESILLRRPDFSLSWPFGFDDNDADDAAASFCFEAAAPPDGAGGVGALTELASSLEKVGLEVVEALTAGLRLENPFRDPSRRSCMVWVSSDHGGEMEGGGGGDEGEGWGSCSGRLYPYVVGVHCQVGGRRSSMQADSGWVTVAEAAETVLVTVGDIAQVWSNGKLKKVRGRPLPINSSPSSIAISLLLTLPMDSIVSPLSPAPAVVAVAGDSVEEEVNEEDGNGGHKFAAFPFEDYAWRVYNERLHFKDPLLRYRLIDSQYY